MLDIKYVKSVVKKKLRPKDRSISIKACVKIVVHILSEARQPPPAKNASTERKQTKRSDKVKIGK